MLSFDSVIDFAAYSIDYKFNIGDYPDDIGSGYKEEVFIITASASSFAFLSSIDLLISFIIC